MSAKPQPALQSGSTKSHRGPARPLIFVVFQFILLFAVSGNIRWVGAWLYAAVYVVAIVAVSLVVPKDVMAARRRPGEGWKKWDKVILPFIIIGPVVLCLIAALDVRYQWTRAVALSTQLVALIPIAMGNALILWAMSTNRHFEGVVRIQHDRGHAVVSDGPYRYVRHPGYVGMMVFNLASPVVLGSRAAFIPAIALVLVLVIRTALEDQTLRSELAGYADYAARVHYRLVPLVW